MSVKENIFINLQDFWTGPKKHPHTSAHARTHARTHTHTHTHNLQDYKTVLDVVVNTVIINWL